MQSFTTRGPDHHFTVDGGRYFLPGFATKEFDLIATFADLEEEPRVDAFREFIAARAKRRWFDVFHASGRNAVLSMGAIQLTDLFAAWVGSKAVTPGESSSSPN